MLRHEVLNRIQQFNPWIIQPENADELIGRFIPEQFIGRNAGEMRNRSRHYIIFPNIPDQIFFIIFKKTTCILIIDVL